MRLLPFLAFFLSGASGLVFQTIWSRLLHHVFGSSSVAISSVVSAFMGGLALGAFWFGRRADRIGRPLLVYACAEIGVGVAGLLVPVLVDSQGFLATVNAWLREQLGAQSGQFMLARFLCILPILIVPTTLMGATLPLLARHFIGVDTDGRAASQRIGQLYAVNTIGAVVGVFLAGFVLMPRVGVALTNTLAACTNFALALGILALRKRLEGMPMEAQGPDATPIGEAEDRHAYPERVRRAAAWAFALSGATALAYEVVWSRALVNTMGASVYAFSLILMTFLTGIAGGSAVASALMTHRGRDLCRGIALAGALLSPLASAPLSVHLGGLGYLSALVAALFAIWALYALRHRRERNDARLASELGRDVAASHDADALAAGALQPLLVPTGISLVALASYEDRLSGMAASVVWLMASLLWLMVLGRRRPLASLAAVQAFIALATFISDLWADELSLAFASTVAPLYDNLPDHVPTVMGLMSLTAGLCVLPSAFGMGAMFPLTMRVWSRGGAHIGRDVGIVYTGNTIGSIVGAWLPGFVLMPAIGMQGTLHVGIAGNLLLATLLVLVGSERDAPPRRRIGAYLAAGLTPVLIAGLYVGSTHAFGRLDWLTWNISKMTLGAFRISLARDVLDEEAWGAPELVYHRDGLSTTVTVERWGRHFSLKNNGKVDASNGDDMPTQIMVAALPLLLHPHGAEGLDVAVIGFGSGATVGAALQFPVRSVQTVELERGVVEASRFFADVNHLSYPLATFPYVQAPRLTVHGDDGRNYLSATTKHFDVIVSEPSNPWLTGVSDLFTREHFQISKQRLADGGVYCQWVQLYEMSPENVKVIYRTFASQFEDVVVFSAEDLSSDTVLVGSDSPLALDLSLLSRNMDVPSVRAELERAYVHVPQDVFARVLLADKAEVLRYTQLEERKVEGTWQAVPAADNSAPCPPESCRRHPALINTDDNAHIEFAAPRDLIGFERYKGYLRSMYASEWPYGHFVDALVVPNEPSRASAAYAQQALSLLAHGRKREARRAVRRARAAAPGPDLLRAQTLLSALTAEAPPAPVPVDLLPEPGATEELPAALYDALREGRVALASGAFDDAFRSLQRIPTAIQAGVGVALVYPYAYAAERAGHHVIAIEALEELLRRTPDVALLHPEIYCILGRAHDALDHFDKGVRNLRVYVDAKQAQLALVDAKPQRGDPSVTDAPGAIQKAFH